MPRIEIKVVGADQWLDIGDYRNLEHAVVDAAMDACDHGDLVDARWTDGSGAARFMVRRDVVEVPACRRCEIEQSLGYCWCDPAANE